VSADGRDDGEPAPHAGGPDRSADPASGLERFDGTAPEYVVGHLEDALARDPRVTEQGLRVAYLEDQATVIVRGTVVDPRHKGAIAEVVGELAPGVHVRDETAVADYPEASGVEDLP